MIKTRQDVYTELCGIARDAKTVALRVSSILLRWSHSYFFRERGRVTREMRVAGENESPKSRTRGIDMAADVEFVRVGA